MLLTAAAASAASAQGAAAGPAGSGVSAAVVHRKLVEREDDGRRLLTERGELLRLQAGGELPLGAGGALRAAASVATGALDYRGQTSVGVALETTTHHRDLALDLGWRPLAPARWGEAWLLVHAVQQRRNIASTSTAQGLRETSALVSPGLGWRHTVDAAGWRWQPALELRASARHRLEVDFGGVFDSADLRGGSRREFVLGLDAGPTGSPWRIGLEWTRARQSASPRQDLTRAGVLAGTVRQPRIEIDDLALRVGRSF